MTDQNESSTTTQTIVYQFMVDAQNAIQRAKEMDAHFAKIKEEMKRIATEAGVSFKTVAAAMIQASKVDFSAQLAQLKETAKEEKWSTEVIKEKTAALKAQQQQYEGGVRKAAQDLQQENKGLLSSFGAVGTAIGTALGFTAVGVVNMLIGSIKNLVAQLAEATEQAYKFAKGMFQIEIAVNALRRAGTEITFAAVNEQLDQLKTKFGIFSKTELVEGAAAFLNLNRDMGFTEEQLFSLQEAVATLAVVNGRAMDEVQKTVALALSSGYTEGLQRLGVSINRVTIAEEAAKMGYADSYMALTEVQRAAATYSLILQKTAYYADDLLKYQKTLPGQIDVMTASIKDLNTETGKVLLPLKELGKEIELAWAKFKLWFAQNSLIVFILKEVGKEIDLLKGKSLGEIFALDPRVVQIWTMLGEAIQKLFKLDFEGFKTQMEEIDKIARDLQSTPMYPYGRTPEGEPITPPGFESGLELAPVVPRNVPPLTDEQVEAVESAAKEINDLLEQYANDQRDMATDLQRDLAEIEENGMQERYDLYVSHLEKIRTINQQYDFDVFDAGMKYSLDTQQAWDDYYSSTADAAAKHANRMLRIEEDYQEKLLRLREGFLMDLDDALRERDARQVLQLIKRYNLERRQADREHDQAVKEENRNYEEQLASLDRQRNDRLKKLKQEYDLRMKMLAIQRERELAEEQHSYEDKLAQQKLEEQRRIDDRKEKYAQDLVDLDTHLKDRLSKIAKGLADENIATQAGMEEMFKIINTYLGKNGLIEGIYAQYVAIVQQYVAAAMQAAAQLSAISNMQNLLNQFNTPVPPPKIPTSPTGTNKALGGIEYIQGGSYKSFPLGAFPMFKSYAKGGMEVASKPTAAIFGETGEPELHIFLPLSNINANMSSRKSIDTKEGKRKGKDKMLIEILLESGLQGKIIDKALDDVADVIFGRTRQ